MFKPYPKIYRAAVLAGLLCLSSGSTAQTDRDPGTLTEADLRYADHRAVLAPFNDVFEQHGEFIQTEFKEQQEEQRRSATSLEAMIAVPQSLRSPMVRNLKNMHDRAEIVLQRSASYSRFKRDDGECRLWISVMEHYVEQLRALAEEMGKSDLPDSAFAGMVMNQVTTASLVMSQLGPAVLPCFVEKGKYIQPLIPMIREKADELRGLKPPTSTLGAR